jgi:putative toxin-antitoxin system antitoxin component (TIGR02293 family)
MAVPADKIAEVLGGRRVLKREIRSLSELDEIVTEGRLPRGAFDAVVARLKLPQRIKFRLVPRATYARHANLPRSHAETTERIARIFALVRELWGDDEDALRFLNTPHPELGGKTPFERAQSELGAREVEEVVERGRLGLPA